MNRHTVLNIKPTIYNGRNTFIFKNSNSHSNLIKTSTNIPKDVNQIKHLFTNYSITPSELEWTFQLRSYHRSLSSSLNNSSDISSNNSFNKKQNPTIPNPPSFYDSDFAKYRKKTKLRLLYSNEPFYKGTNSFSLYHLIQKGKACSVNPTILNFGSTLRDFKHNKTTSPNWVDLPYRPVYNEKQSSYLPPLLEKSKEKYKKLDRFILKKYKILLQKVKYRNDTINKKSVVEDKTQLPIYSSAHLSMEKYNPTYENKNIGQVRHLLKQSNSTAKFEIGLREGFEMTTRNFNNKIRENNIKQSSLHKSKSVNRFKNLMHLE